MKLGTQPLDPGLTVRASLLKWLGEPRHAFTARTAAAAKAWQPRARRAFLACLGDAPPPSATPMRTRVLERVQLDGYSRTLFTLDTARNLKALCWLCVPDGVNLQSSTTRVPAMIATPGHGIGAKDLIALDAKGEARKEGEGYQKDYALQAVRLGYPTLVVEPMSFGERRDADHMSGKSTESPCQAGATVATMLGTTLARIRMNDLQRGLDYLGTLPGIDAARVGIMGISGGGQMALWTAAAEPRIRAAIVSGYFNTFRHSVMGMHHCICNFAPGLARDFDMTDLAALVAPRAMLIEGGTKDPIFPIAATRAAVRRARAIYKVFGVPGRVGADIFEADHQWSGKKMGAFLGKAL
ncbi:MAG: prolyl oligopeptidase family serine peptidase [Planctomycetes bacterium]|nr:prolyl oligopeptidase family serine peptidase [Planctomycetota bacterium]